MGGLVNKVSVRMKLCFGSLAGTPRELCWGTEVSVKRRVGSLYHGGQNILEPDVELWQASKA